MGLWEYRMGGVDLSSVWVSVLPSAIPKIPGQVWACLPGQSCSDTT